MRCSRKTSMVVCWFEESQMNNFRISFLIGLIGFSALLVPTILYLVVFGCAAHFNLTPVLYAMEILKVGRLTPITGFDNNVYWGSTINVEKSYPIPSLIHAILLSVLNIQAQHSAYIPLLIPSTLVFYTLAYRILLLNFISREKVYSRIYSLLYAIFTSYSLLSILYTGRPHLGIILFTYIIYMLMLNTLQPSKRSHVIVLFFFAYTLTLTYYTTTFILMSLSLVLLLWRIFRMYFHSNSNENLWMYKRYGNPFLALLILSTAGFFIFNPFMLEYAYSLHFTINGWIKNICETIKMIMVEKEYERLYYTAAVVNKDFTAMILKRMVQTVKLSSIISIPLTMAVHIISKIKKLNDMRLRIAFFFSIIIAIISVSEHIFYIGVNPYVGFRFEPLYGLILLFWLFDFVFSKICLRKKKLIQLCVILWIAIGCFGCFYEQFSYGWDYELKFYANTFIQFIASSNLSKIQVYSDAFTSSEVIYRARIFNIEGAVDPIPYTKIIFDNLLNANVTALANKELLFYVSRTPILPEAASWASKKSVSESDIEVIVKSSDLLYASRRLLLLSLSKNE